MDIEKDLRNSANYIMSRTMYRPKIAIILGSGLGKIAEEIENKEIYNYIDIPNFPVSTVIGHKGRLIIGRLNGKVVVAMQGRLHHYEGYSMQQVTFPVRVMSLLGVEKLIVTNASGAVNLKYRPGQLMLIKDHINLSFDNPLIGKNMDSFGPRFPDMSNAYDKKLRERVKEVAKENGIELQEGVYVCMSGPNYETPAEIKMIRIIGGDVVGMSTVPEVIVANHEHMKVIGISCVTNMAAGILHKLLDHKEVIETSKYIEKDFEKLLRNIICEL
ncbi:purine-nucleoside phosphorylase [Clostridium sp. LBM24168]